LISSKTSRTITIILVVIFTLNFLPTTVHSNDDDELSIQIAIGNINWSYSAPNRLTVKLAIKVSYYGESPPEEVFITPSIPDLNPDNVDSFYYLVKPLGPWVEINPNYWVLNSTIDNENLPNFAQYHFSLITDNEWPNQKWGEVVIFVGHSATTISGDDNSHIKGKFVTVNKNPELYNYYWLWANMPLSNQSIMLPEQDGSQNSQSKIGTFFSLVLSHELTKVESFSYLPPLLNFGYPLLFLLFTIIAIISTLFDKKLLIGTLLAIDVALIGHLFTTKFWISDYIPVWERAINFKIDGCLFLLLTLFVVIVVIYILGIPIYSRLTSFLENKLQRKSKKKRKKNKSYKNKIAKCALVDSLKRSRWSSKR
jgi:hypothetical protein